MHKVIQRMSELLHLLPHFYNSLCNLNDENEQWARWVFPTPFSSIIILQSTPERIQMKHSFNQVLVMMSLISIKVYGVTYRVKWNTNRLIDSTKPFNSHSALRLKMMWMHNVFTVHAFQNHPVRIRIPNSISFALWVVMHTRMNTVQWARDVSSFAIIESIGIVIWREISFDVGENAEPNPN